MSVYRSTPIVSRIFDNIMGQTGNMRYVIHDGWLIFVMAPERLPRGWAQEAHHLAVAPRLSHVVRRVAWDATAAFWRGNSGSPADVDR